MKYYYLLATCLIFLACENKPQASLKFEGPAMAAVPTLISRAQCETQLGTIASGEAVLFTAGDKVLVSQFDDLDGDGNWDEAVLILDWPSELSLKKVPMAEVAEAVTRTNLHLAKVITMGEEYEEVSFGERIAGTETKVTQKHFQYEGPGWENDVIAFRNYFDERNGFDIFGKVTTDMVLQQVGTGQNYHDMLPWGMDILKVGNSLGSGGIALWYQDSLYRVSVPQGATYKSLIEGPKRSTFELRFPAMSVGEHSLEVVHRVSIYAGVNGFSSEVSVSPHVAGMALAVGIVNLETEAFFQASDEGTETIYTYGDQAFLHEALGMGVVGHKADFMQAYTAAEEGSGVIQTFASILKLYPNKATPYLFIAGWEKTSDKFSNQEGFASVLATEAQRWQYGLGGN
ncbi:MAG: DUF4861 family protein [Bacteroidota bacterium]